ncbi:DL-endopeptidase inhibitor IseA family protein [Cohnella sp.]|uniref:DL-endopeptidase inhibitor IseA family protein n=1 Tax=Cohnella sp. TaxID=1883426 RepID=UPI00356552AE
MLKTSFTVKVIKAFINQAESLWLTAFESSQSGQSIFIRGDEYRKFPVRFNTRAKLLAYFKNNWSCRLSVIMLCNLNPILFRGSLYEIVADPGPVPNRVVRLQVISQTSSRLHVKAVMSGGDEGNETIFYTLSTASGRLKIISRSGRSTDYRYLPCRR